MEIQSPDPAKLAARWSEIIEEPVSRDEAGNTILPIENATIRFVRITDGRPEGLAGMDLLSSKHQEVLSRARARNLLRDDAIMICGMRFRLV